MLSHEKGNEYESHAAPRLYDDAVSLNWRASPHGGLFAVELRIIGDNPTTFEEISVPSSEDAPVDIKFRHHILTEVILKFLANDLDSDKSEKVKELLGESIYSTCVSIKELSRHESGSIDIRLHEDAISPQIHRWLQLRDSEAGKFTA